MTVIISGRMCRGGGGIQFTVITVMITLMTPETTIAERSEIIPREKAIDFLSSQTVTGHVRSKRGIFNGKEVARRAYERIEDAKEVEKLHRELSCRRRCWEEWANWSPCSRKCNSGTQSRVRKQKIPADCRGVPCPGPAHESRACVMVCTPGGKVKNGNCECHPGYLGQCCKQRVTCPKPPKLENGQFDGVVTWPALYDQVVVQKCREGFVLIGPEQRRCQLNGKLSGTNSRCQRVTCQAPKSPPNGHLLNTKNEYFYGDTVGYDCTIGYSLEGVSSRTCAIANSSSAGVWTAFTPTCSIIDCEHPGVLENGTINGNQYTYDKTVRFQCKHGFQLVGAEQRKCLQTGKWSDKQPICKEIRCRTVDRPLHGSQSTRDNSVDVTMEFSCKPGYELVGMETITCTSNGTWDSAPPTCEAIRCRDPGKPAHGSRHDNGLYFGMSVNFTCHDGYILEGASTATCRANRTWSHSLPTCTACPKDHYKDGSTCHRCPANSHTVTIAAASKQQCTCNHGYTGPNGGPCTEIVCPAHRAPSHGRIVSCRRKLGQICVFDCDAGYTLIGGSSLRTCTEAGTWDGLEPRCEACPLGTYKASVASCLPCPIHSHTVSTASTKDDCLCNTGYIKDNDGTCIDYDECSTNDGKGPCEQGCQNFVGKFNCICTVPGYKLHSNDRTCIPEKQCTNLTESDAPAHGGLVCHWYHEQNSQQCTVKCNPGYEMPTRVNAYETCGSATGFVWSFRRVDRNASLNPCIEEFFPDFRFEADSAYFVRECRQLTDTEKDEVKREFAKTLTKEGVCIKRNTQICNMKDVGIICSRTSRRKRGTQETEVDEAKLHFNIVATKMEAQSKNCDQICPMLRIPAHLCDRYCLRVYKRILRAAVLFARRQLTQMYGAESSRARLLFNAANREFIPKSALTNITNILIDCPVGMIKENDMCVPCSSGTSYNVTRNECVPCAIGSYQPNTGQSECLQCPIGQTTSKSGASNCQDCPEGSYGRHCAQKCSCLHGKCDAKTGKCICDSGWTGVNCDLDIPGCKETSCYRNVTCTDIPAPGTGHTCGSCPHAYTGDGMICMKLLGA